jgi:hypothetical protein
MFPWELDVRVRLERDLGNSNAYAVVSDRNPFEFVISRVIVRSESIKPFLSEELDLADE